MVPIIFSLGPVASDALEFQSKQPSNAPHGGHQLGVVQRMQDARIMLY